MHGRVAPFHQQYLFSHPKAGTLWSVGVYVFDQYFPLSSTGRHLENILTVHIYYCIVGNFEGEKLYNFIATHQSFLHKSLRATPIYAISLTFGEMLTFLPIHESFLPTAIQCVECLAQGMYNVPTRTCTSYFLRCMYIPWMWYNGTARVIPWILVKMHHRN